MANKIWQCIFQRYAASRSYNFCNLLSLGCSHNNFQMGFDFSCVIAKTLWSIYTAAGSAFVETPSSTLALCVGSPLPGGDRGGWAYAAL